MKGEGGVGPSHLGDWKIDFVMQLDSGTAADVPNTGVGLHMERCPAHPSVTQLAIYNVVHTGPGSASTDTEHVCIHTCSVSVVISTYMYIV